MCKIATLNFSMGFNIVAPYMVSATPEYSPPTLTRDITCTDVELKSGWRRNGRGAYPRGLEPKTMSNAGELTR